MELPRPPVPPAGRDASSRSGAKMRIALCRRANAPERFYARRSASRLERLGLRQGRRSGGAEAYREHQGSRERVEEQRVETPLPHAQRAHITTLADVGLGGGAVRLRTSRATRWTRRARLLCGAILRTRLAFSGKQYMHARRRRARRPPTSRSRRMGRRCSDAVVVGRSATQNPPSRNTVYHTVGREESVLPLVAEHRSFSREGPTSLTSPVSGTIFSTKSLSDGMQSARRSWKQCMFFAGGRKGRTQVAVRRSQVLVLVVGAVPPSSAMAIVSTRAASADRCRDGRLVVRDAVDRPSSANGGLARAACGLR